MAEVVAVTVTAVTAAEADLFVDGCLAAEATATAAVAAAEVDFLLMVVRQRQ